MSKLLITHIYPLTQKMSCELPLFLSHIQAGFPSPADDYIDQSLDLNEYLIDHPAATFFVRVEGDSMIDAGIRSGDILIVDRAKSVTDNKVAVIQLNGEFTVKRIRRINGSIFLLPENPLYKPIEVTEDMSCEIWGMVTFVIHAVR